MTDWLTHTFIHPPSLHKNPFTSIYRVLSSCLLLSNVPSRTLLNKTIHHSFITHIHPSYHTPDPTHTNIVLMMDGTHWQSASYTNIMQREVYDYHTHETLHSADIQPIFSICICVCCVWAGDFKYKEQGKKRIKNGCVCDICVYMYDMNGFSVSKSPCLYSDSSQKAHNYCIFPQPPVD